MDSTVHENMKDVPQSVEDENATPAKVTRIEAEQTSENPRKRKRTSKAWDEFKEITLLDGSKKAECIYCKSRLRMSKSGTTTQYNRHLQRCTQRVMVKRGSRQLTIDATTGTLSQRVNAVNKWTWDPAKVKEVFAQMLSVHELPLNFVEYEGFNMFMRVCCPDWDKLKQCLVVNEPSEQDISEMSRVGTHNEAGHELEHASPQ